MYPISHLDLSNENLPTNGSNGTSNCSEKSNAVKRRAKEA